MEFNSAEEITTPSHHIRGGSVRISLAQLKKQVTTLAGLLEGLNSNTEEEFLAIGSSLNNFYSRVADISKNPGLENIFVGMVRLQTGGAG